MLCPEVWYFKAPESTLKSEKGELSQNNCLENIKKNYYNHLVSVVVPDTLRTPEFLCDLLISDCEYYKISNFSLNELIEKDFISNFIKKGSFTALSINTRIDCDDCVSVTPDGVIVLSLTKDSYQSFGLDGSVSHFCQNTKGRYRFSDCFSLLSALVNIDKWELHQTNSETQLIHGEKQSENPVISDFKLGSIKTMPRYREVPTLQSLCLEGVGALVVSLAPSILTNVQLCSEPQKGVACLKNSLVHLEQLLVCNVPRYLYDAMAMQVLQSVKELIDKTKKTYDQFAPMSVFLTEMNVVVSLTEVVLNQNLREIDFSIWPKIMRYVLYKNLSKLTGLEVLNLGSCTGGWRTSDNDKCLMEGIMGMKNLRSLCLCFDCSDGVIQVLGDNCPHLQSLDVTSSRSVTDRSVPSLLKCKQLRELQLHRTSVSVVGFAQLLVGLPKLQDLGRCDEFGNVVKYVHQNYSTAGCFGLRKLQTRDLSTESLRFLVAMCPKVEHVCLFHDEHISDFMILTTLDNLKELKLSSCAFYADFVKQLLEVRGCNLTSLHLEHVEEIDLNAIMHISQYCPLLKNLVLYNCDFVDQRTPYPRLKVKPYQHLERVFWVVDCAVNHLEFLLTHSVNIKFIHLGSSTGITHSSIVKILAANPMKNLEELRILYSYDMSIRTVELLLASCSQLKVLSELESWQGISMEELKSFRQYIHSNNFDLDIRPTLSY